MAVIALVDHNGDGNPGTGNACLIANQRLPTAFTRSKKKIEVITPLIKGGSTARLLALKHRFGLMFHISSSRSPSTPSPFASFSFPSPPLQIYLFSFPSFNLTRSCSHSSDHALPILAPWPNMPLQRERHVSLTCEYRLQRCREPMMPQILPSEIHRAPL